MKTMTSLALTLCVFAVAASPRKASAGRSAVKDSAAAWRGMLVDSRDGKNYRTIRIGNQVWMAENLNYATGNSWCYENDSDNCAKWGRLYDWQTARSACPSGWHLPSDEEWRELAEDDGQGNRTSGTALKSIEMKGTDATGFNARPGGNRYDDGRFIDAGRYASFWSLSECDGLYDGLLAEPRALSRFLRAGDEILLRGSSLIGNGFSVRCLEDAR